MSLHDALPISREFQRWRAGGGVHHANVAHENTRPETGAHCLGESLLGSEAFGIGSRPSMRTPGRFGALCIGKDPRLKPLAETVERILDAFDIAEVRSQPDNHRTRSICRLIPLIDSFRPQ